jgi:hypothetical protein
MISRQPIPSQRQAHRQAFGECHRQVDFDGEKLIMGDGPTPTRWCIASAVRRLRASIWLSSSQPAQRRRRRLDNHRLAVRDR